MVAIDLKIESKIENLHKVEALIENICRDLQLEEDAFGNLLIAVTEAVNNAIQHGNKNNPEKTVNIQFKKEQDNLMFSIEDEGDGFDYENLPDPTAPENIENPSGRGVFLMKNLADGVDFQNNGKRVDLKFNLMVAV